MRTLLAVWFFAHGVAHLPGFLVSWQLRTFPDLPFRTTILANSVDVGTVGVRLIGVGWLLSAVAFMALAVAAMLQVAWWQEATYVVLGFSLILCVLGWPRSWIGVTSNIAVAVLLASATRFGWV
jgi:hypothetical protein